MTDPVRRDPSQFLRTLKKMANTTSWQKAMVFASKGRMVGYELGIDHYNTILFSQSLWGRALEMTQVIRCMQEDGVRPNGISYYYICNGMGNVDHGYAQDFPANRKLKALQHWRVALGALEACEYNRYDATDTMYSSVIASCTIPEIDRWREALAVFHRAVGQERKVFPTAVGFLHNCLVRNRRPQEASALMRFAADKEIPGYIGAWEPDVYTALPADAPVVKLDEVPEYKQERRQLHPKDCVPTDAGEVFRPRVYRYLWYKWHAVANKYRPTATLHRRQLSPRHSPTGVPGFNRL